VACDVTVTGTVTEFAFRNPHVLLYLEIKNENGELVTYEIEMSNISNTVRRGIRPVTFKPGDVVDAEMAPARRRLFDRLFEIQLVDQTRATP